MWRLKFTQASLVAVAFGLCYFVVGVEPVYGDDSEANLTAMLKLGGLPTSHYLDEGGFAIRINDYWIGLYQASHPALDSPVLLWVGILFLLSMLYQLLFEWDAGDNLLQFVLVNAEKPDAAPQASLSLERYLSPHDPLWGMLSSSKAETIISGGRQITQVPVRCTIAVHGKNYQGGNWYLSAAEDRSLSLTSANCFMTLHEVDGKWKGWWNGGEGAQDANLSLGYLARDDAKWSGDGISINVAPDPNAPTIVADDEPEKKPQSLKRYAAFAGTLAIVAGIKIAAHVLPQQEEPIGPGTVEENFMTNTADEMNDAPDEMVNAADLVAESFEPPDEEYNREINTTDLGSESENVAQQGPVTVAPPIITAVPQPSYQPE